MGSLIGISSLLFPLIKPKHYLYLYKFFARKRVLQDCRPIMMVDTPLRNENPGTVQSVVTAVTEGQATVNFPSSLDVFYNPVQEFNRDLSVAVLRLYASDSKIAREARKLKLNQANTENVPKVLKYIKLKEEDFTLTSSNTMTLPKGEVDNNGIRILEALAASGLRSIRYAKEVGGIKEVLANDICSSAIDCMKVNLASNQIEHIVTSSQNDASLLMYQNRRLEDRFDVIDLDPYGSPHTFLDGAVQCVADGGLLLVTSTDMAVLCGNAPGTCYSKYGSLSLKVNSCHEMALRILLQYVEACANKYGRYIVPLLSVSVDFYCRVFVQVFTSQSKCKESYSKLSWIYYCPCCESVILQRLGSVIKNDRSIRYTLCSPTVGPKCTYCAGAFQIGGPIWSDPIHNKNFVSRLIKTLRPACDLGTLKRLEGMLSMIEEELPDVPLYIVIDRLFGLLRMTSCKRKELVSAILNAGYRVSSSHANRNGLKTDAPMEFIWEMLKAKERITPVDVSKLPPHHPARIILRGEKRCHEEVVSEEERTQIDFTEHPDAEPPSRKQKLLRFPVNPPNWGPKMKSVTSLSQGDVLDRSRRKQGKRKNKKEMETSEISDQCEDERRDLDSDSNLPQMRTQDFPK